jgi:hypothetical protein
MSASVVAPVVQHLHALQDNAHALPGAPVYAHSAHQLPLPCPATLQGNWSTEYTVKSSWWRQLFKLNGDSPEALDVKLHFPNIKMINWFDIIKEETGSQGNMVNWAVSRAVNITTHDAFLLAMRQPEQSLLKTLSANTTLASNKTALNLAAAYFHGAPMPDLSNPDQLLVVDVIRDGLLIDPSLRPASPSLPWLLKHEGALWGFVDWHGAIVLGGGVLVVVGYFIWQAIRRGLAMRWAARAALFHGGVLAVLVLLQLPACFWLPLVLAAACACCHTSSNCPGLHMVGAAHPCQLPHRPHPQPCSARQPAGASWNPRQRARSDWQQRATTCAPWRC